MVALDPDYAAVDTAVTELIRVNRADADATLARVRSLQRSSLFWFGGLALFGIALSIVLGAAVTHVVQRGELQLTRQAALLEEQNRELDAFAGRVAHDLRGPLTTIKLAVDNLARGVSRGRAEALLLRGVDRMQSLIEDLLAFSRVDEKLAAAVCDPSVAAAQVRQDVTSRVEHEGVRLVVEVEPARVRCSEGLLRQVLWNLVDNAVKYHRDGIRPEVEIRGRAAEPGYDLVVRDNGMGMSADEVQHAFEPLYRGGRVRKIEGTGLGLSLVKRILDAAGGAVAVESEVGQGTTFVLHLPRA
jgi:signal transduction histidine kinase